MPPPAGERQVGGCSRPTVDTVREFGRPKRLDRFNPWQMAVMFWLQVSGMSEELVYSLALSHGFQIARFRASLH